MPASPGRPSGKADASDESGGERDTARSLVMAGPGHVVTVPELSRTTVQAGGSIAAVDGASQALPDSGGLGGRGGGAGVPPGGVGAVGRCAMLTGVVCSTTHAARGAP